MFNKKNKKTKLVERKTIQTSWMKSFVKKVLFNLVMIPFFYQTQANVTTIVNKKSVSGIPTLWHFN
jgi:hypothetical protein